MTRSVIQAEGLGKRYRRGMKASSDTLYESLSRIARSPLSVLRRAPQDTFWALRDVSFEVNEGDVLGLIGRNGAGKTTLLKVLARITRPTSGWAEIRGRVRSLLEVGTGFHSELTGRENTYLSGSILGMSKNEIARKFDEIVAFAEIEKFIDTPVKHYSSGMYVRLAFAVAAHLEPEILLVDEVLAVGDIAFQKKCLAKMGEVAHTGRTIVFVTHQMNQIRRLCEKVIWIDGGTIRMAGPTAEVAGAYEAAVTSGAASGGADRGEKARFLSWEILEPRSSTQHMLTSLGPVTIRFVVQVTQPLRRGQHGAALFNVDRQLMWAWAKDDVRIDPGIHSFTYSFPMLPLRPGAYAWQVSLWEDREMLELWDCLPEMNIATQVFQHPMDEWNGVLNIPCDFSIVEGNGELSASRPRF